MPAIIRVADPRSGQLGSRSARLAAGSILLVMLLAGLPGCALFRPAAAVPLELQQLGSQMEAQRFGEIHLRGLFLVRNPNPFPVTLEETERSLRLEERAVLAETDQILRVVPAGGELELPVRLSITSERIRESVERIPDDGQLAVTLQMAVRAGGRDMAGVGFVTAEWHDRLPLLEAPRLGFRDFTVSALSPLQADYELVLDLINPNRFTVRLLDLDLDLVIDGTSFGRIEAIDLNRGIRAGETVTVRVDRSQRLTGADGRLFSLLQPGRKIEVAVSGEARFSFSFGGRSDSALSPLPAAISASGRVER